MMAILRREALHEFYSIFVLPQDRQFVWCDTHDTKLLDVGRLG